jgi:signal transduction histidine kinase
MEAQYTKPLPEMDLRKAEMLASMSHELRSPMTSIKGYAATLLRYERRISHEERHEFLVAITEASDRLTVVIDRLLEMSQLETDMVRMEYSSVNLAYLVREALTAIEQRPGRVEHLTTFSHIPEEMTFALHLEDCDGMPTDEELLIQADRYYLREVLDNLLENARSYSPEGGTVDVVVRPVGTREYMESIRTLMALREDKSNGEASESASFLQRDRQMVEICVHDTGIGIPREHLERIFERFHRIDTRLTREVTGLGLGLAICKRIVELHHGVIWAESEVGQGSTFHVLLPVDGWA